MPSWPRASFDAWIYQTQLPELTDLARAFPGNTIVLDHMGGVLGIGPYPGRPGEVRLQWLAQHKVLAGCTNVVLKLGGMGMRLFGFDFAKREAPELHGADPDLATLS